LTTENPCGRACLKGGGCECSHVYARRSTLQQFAMQTKKVQRGGQARAEMKQRRKKEGGGKKA
jgi:hypothetical protein